MKQLLVMTLLSFSFLSGCAHHKCSSCKSDKKEMSAHCGKEKSDCRCAEKTCPIEKHNKKDQKSEEKKS